MRAQSAGRLSRRQVTWAEEVPSDNQITAGQWWGDNPEPGYVSVEQDYGSGSISVWVTGLN